MDEELKRVGIFWIILWVFSGTVLSILTSSFGGYLITVVITGWLYLIHSSIIMSKY